MKKQVIPLRSEQSEGIPVIPLLHHTRNAKQYRKTPKEALWGEAGSGEVRPGVHCLPYVPPTLWVAT